ncbi:MAG: ROK family protein, partial [candidate division KSB1 bacterium]
MDFALGLDLGGTNIKLVCVAASGEVIAQRSIATHDDARAVWAEHVKSLIATIEHERGAQAKWLGLAAPGLATRDHRAIAFMPGRMQGLEQLDWTNYLQRDQTVTVLNDAHAALLGEHWLGAAKNFAHAILLTLGTGVGGAILSHGKLLTGALGRAGHLGHICLNLNGEKDIVNTPGSIELLLGDCTIHARSQGRFASTEKLMAAHLAGDQHATQVWSESIYALACAIASFINILDPEAVIIGGGISKAGAALFEPLEKFLN